jgi:hypothetical protein
MVKIFGVNVEETVCEFVAGELECVGRLAHAH